MGSFGPTLKQSHLLSLENSLIVGFSPSGSQAILRIQLLISAVEVPAIDIPTSCVYMVSNLRSPPHDQVEVTSVRVAVRSGPVRPLGHNGSLAARESHVSVGRAERAALADDVEVAQVGVEEVGQQGQQPGAVPQTVTGVADELDSLAH